MPRLLYVTKATIMGVGELPLKEGTTTFTPSNTSREGVMAENATYSGWVGKKEFAKLDCTLVADAGIDPQSLGVVEDANITVELSDGSLHMMVRAFSHDVPSLSKGEVKVVYWAPLSQKLS